MARVVQRRRGIPWALIIFVFLFLIAATFAVLWRMELDETNEKLAKETKERKLLAKKADKVVGDTAALIDRAKKAGEKSVVAALHSRQKALIAPINGNPDDSAEATLKAIDDLYKEELIRDAPAVKAGDGGRAKTLTEAGIEISKGLTGAIRQLSVRHNTAVVNARSHELAKTTAETARDKWATLAASQEEAFKQKASQLSAEIVDLQKGNKLLHEQAQAQLADTNSRWQNQVNTLRKDVSGHVERIKADRIEIADLNSKLAKAKRHIEEFLRPGMQRTIAYRPDGKVLRAKRDEGIVYINLGKKHRVVPGLTFAVYSGKEGMPLVKEDEGEVSKTEKLRGKAELSVMDVFDNISMCRVEWMKNRNVPVVSGDIIANLAFDVVRTYRFVIIGDFDLYGTGAPVAADVDRVKQLIRRFRSTVTKTVDVRTDFVILGDRPSMPAESEGFVTEHEDRVRDEIVARMKRYDETKEAAGKNKVPILNTNRFLALIGYHPVRTLKQFGLHGQ